MPEVVYDISIKDCPVCGNRMDSLGYDLTAGRLVFQCPRCGHQENGATIRQWDNFLNYEARKGDKE